MDVGCLLARGDHAATCSRCRSAAGQDRAIAGLVNRVQPESWPAGNRDRSLDAAMAVSITAPPARRRGDGPIVLAIAAAAVMVIAVSLRGRGPAPVGLATRERTIAAETWTPIGHARVRLERDGVAWQSSSTEIVLVAGRVEVEVDPSPHRQFRVVTSAFAVEVLGTVFTVDLEHVEVRRGAVRVVSPAGDVLVERLAVGERWSNARTVRDTAPAHDPAAAPPVAADEIAMDGVEIAPAPSPRGPASPPRTSQSWLAEARSLLGAGDVIAARAAVRHALAARPSRPIRADAEALIAESYLRGGELDTAITHFRGVADRYRDLPTGEAALYAAARYEAKAGHGEAARRLYQTYLQRYPRGALAKQAAAQLRASESP